MGAMFSSTNSIPSFCTQEKRAMDTVATKNSLVNFIILLFYDKRPGACAPGLNCRIINSLN